MPALSAEELRVRLDEARGDETRLRAQRDALIQRATADGRLNDPGVVTKTTDLGAGISNAAERAREAGEALRHAERHLEYLRSIADDPAHTEAGATFHTPSRAADDVPPAQRAARDGAMRAIEQMVDAGDLRSDAADRLDAHLRADRLGLDADYLRAVADPHYNSAFGKLITYGPTSALRMTPAEQATVQEVARVEQMRAMAVGTGSAGGFAVPASIDPSIVNTSDGALNPMRQLARVETISSATEWKGVSAAGVTSAYGAEGSEVDDNTPTLVQPAIKAERWTSFVPFSIEVGQDWATLQRELAALMADSKDSLDAAKFLAGDGSDEPGGILNIGSTGGLTTGQRVLAGTASFAVAHPYSLKQALPPRYQANAAWLASGTIIDAAYRFVAAGDTDEPPLVSPDRTAMLGKPLHEWSTMKTTTTAGDKILLYGDMRQAFCIVDRLGVSLELVPHLFGGSGRPTGQRGLLAIGRTGSGVINPNAARYLEVT